MSSEGCKTNRALHVSNKQIFGLILEPIENFAICWEITKKLHQLFGCERDVENHLGREYLRNTIQMMILIEFYQN